MTIPMTAAALKRPAYHLLLAPEGTDPDTVTEAECETHHVLVHAGDQLRAELEASKLGLRSPKDTPMHLTLLWLWAAMVRTGATALAFREFKVRVLAWEPDRDRPAPHTGDDAEADELDPDPTEASTS